MTTIRYNQILLSDRDFIIRQGIPYIYIMKRHTSYKSARRKKKHIRRKKTGKQTQMLMSQKKYRPVLGNVYRQLMYHRVHRSMEFGFAFIEFTELMAQNSLRINSRHSMAQKLLLTQASLFTPLFTHKIHLFSYT